MNDHGLDLKSLALYRDKVSLYRSLIKDPVIDEFYKLITFMTEEELTLEGFINRYNDFYFALTENKSPSFKEYVIEKIIFDENAYTLSLGASLEDIAKRDLRNLIAFSKITPTELKEYVIDSFKDSIRDIKDLPNFQEISVFEKEYPSHIRDLLDVFDREDIEEIINELKIYHEKFGTGEFARYKAFIWEEVEREKCLRGIDSPDEISLKNLIGYKAKREIIIENTLQFINNFPANNMLLYGDRGTGKSSTVKALLNEYYAVGLRIVELPKEHLKDFPEIIRILRNRPQKFIVFIDDLTFEDGETGYTSLKAVLEGSVEAKPKNVLIYATSNRRHLVKEYFHERKGLVSQDPNEEVHASDSIEEKLSLADRFGITVVFSSPSQEEYLEIVKGLAKNRGLTVEEDYLIGEAIKWERQHNGRSARTARQFIDFLEGKIGLSQ